MKKLVFTVGLVLLLGLGYAQKQTGIIVIEYDYWLSRLSISKNGTEFAVEKIKNQDQKKIGGETSVNPLISKVSEYQTLGWELINMTTLIDPKNNHRLHYAYLVLKSKQ
jgi:hypothetical protein